MAMNSCMNSRLPNARVHMHLRYFPIISIRILEKIRGIHVDQNSWNLELGSTEFTYEFIPEFIPEFICYKKKSTHSKSILEINMRIHMIMNSFRKY